MRMVKKKRGTSSQHSQNFSKRVFIVLILVVIVFSVITSMNLFYYSHNISQLDVEDKEEDNVGVVSLTIEELKVDADESKGQISLEINS